MGPCSSSPAWPPENLGTCTLADVSFASVAAFVYLILIGALVGYVAYIWLLHHVSVTAASTYAFVNPVVAVALGALVLGEQVTLVTLVAATLIVGAVVVLLIGQSRKIAPAVAPRGARPRRRLRACSPVTGDNGSVDSETLIVDTPAEPHRPRPGIGLKDVLCVGPIIANGIYYYAGLPLTPLLLGRNPVLLSALRGSIASMVTAGAFARVGKVPLLLALIAPLPISMITDPFFFWAGKRYGRSSHQPPQRNRSPLAQTSRAG